MQTLLVVQSSPRAGQSMSRGLADGFVAEWTKAHPKGRVIMRDLMESDLPFVTMPWLNAYFTPLDGQTPEMKEALLLSDTLVQELQTADHIVFATPVYNYNVPAVLKAYIDHVVRKGVTLGLSGEGLLKGKVATLLIASGGVYTTGSPIEDRDIATRYLQLILRVIGIEDVRVISAGNAKSVDMGQVTQAAFLQTFASDIAIAAGSLGC